MIASPFAVSARAQQFVSVRDKGAVGDGTTLDTAAFTAAAADSKFVLVPYAASGYNVGSDVVNSGSTFIFLGGYPYSQLVGSATVHQLKGVGFNAGQITAEQMRLILSPNTLTGTNEGGKRALFIQQHEPDLTSVDYGTGPFFFNSIETTWTGRRDGSGGVGSSTSAVVHGFQVGLSVGGAAYSLASAAAIGAGLIHTANDTSDGDKVGINAGVSTNFTSPGKIYGASFSFTANASASTPQAVGIETDCFVMTGAAVDDAVGINAWSGGTAQATDAYSAFGISRSGAGSAVPWKTGFMLYTKGGTLPQPISTTGSLFATDGTATLANIFAFANVTVTGDIFKFVNFRVNGAGIVFPGQNVAFPAGFGCDFTASTHTTEPGTAVLESVQRDYEYGTWTPVLSDGTHADATYTTQAGTYVVVGNLVSIRGKIAITSLGTISGALRITGLPFTSSGPSEPAVTIGRAEGLSLPAAGNVIGGWVGNGTKLINLELWDATAGQTGLLHSEFGATGVLSFACSYIK